MELSNKVPGWWIQRAFKPVAAEKYACKADSTLIMGPWSKGGKTSQGQRTELASAAAAIRGGASVADLRGMDEHLLTVAKYSKFLTEIELDCLTNGSVPVTWPLVFEGYTMNKPDPAVKKRHLWFCAPPDYGKTFKLGEVLKGMKVAYFQGHNKNNSRFESYNNEELIVYDDATFDFSEISMMTNTIPFAQRIPVRYTCKILRPNSTRNVIVLSNHLPQQHGFSAAHLDAVLARFNVIDKTPAAIFD